MKAGQTASLKVTAYDKAGKAISDAAVRVSAGRTDLSYSHGVVTAFKAGSFNMIASAPRVTRSPNLTLKVLVLVTWPQLRPIVIVAAAGKLYVGTSLAHKATGTR